MPSKKKKKNQKRKQSDCEIGLVALTNHAFLFPVCLWVVPGHKTDT